MEIRWRELSIGEVVRLEWPSGGAGRHAAGDLDDGFGSNGPNRHYSASDYDGNCIRAEFDMIRRFAFFVLERHRVAAHTSSRPPAVAMPGLSA
jgi:hypothetical protein